LQDIYAPPSSSIDLSKVKQGAVVTFAGTTTFGFTNLSTFDPIILGGKAVRITGAPGHIIDGNGQAYWDGIGSNGGVPKWVPSPAIRLYLILSNVLTFHRPNHMLAVSKMSLGSVIENLYIQNWPVHCFSISNCADLTIRNIVLNGTAGDAPNARSNGLPAGHNSDGFDLSGCNNTLLTDSTVYNQDDCVAVTSGNNVTVNNMYCSGGHGMSIGSVGGKSNNNVTNIVYVFPFVFLPFTFLFSIFSYSFNFSERGSKQSMLTVGLNSAFPIPKSFAPRTAPASNQTTTPPASSPTSPTPTSSSPASPSTVSMSSKTTSTAAQQAIHQTALSFRICYLIE
jgi:hypothetical protein